MFNDNMYVIDSNVAIKLTPKNNFTDNIYAEFAQLIYSINENQKIYYKGIEINSLHEFVITASALELSSIFPVKKIMKPKGNKEDETVIIEEMLCYDIPYHTDYWIKKHKGKVEYEIANKRYSKVGQYQKEVDKKIIEITKSGLMFRGYFKYNKDSENGLITGLQNRSDMLEITKERFDKGLYSIVIIEDKELEFTSYDDLKEYLDNKHNKNELSILKHLENREKIEIYDINMGFVGKRNRLENHRLLRETQELLNI